MKKLFMKDQRGQAMVELALVLPILLVLFMGVVEFGRIYYSHLIITNASREGARVAVLGKSDTDIGARVTQVASELDTTRVQTTVSPNPSLRTAGAISTVAVSYSLDLIFPPFEAFIPNPLTITSSTTMRVE